MEHYLFAAYNDIERSIEEGLFYIAEKTDNSIDLELYNPEASQLEFTMIFNYNYVTIKLDQEQFDSLYENIDSKSELLKLVSKIN